MQNLLTHEAMSAEEGMDTSSGTYRIGGVSRLTGVPVTTLRVWETRHAAFTPAKSAGRHRLYTDLDVMRARLLRQLSAGGHSVSGIARLPLPQLQRLLAGIRVDTAPASAAIPNTLSLVVVGEALAARMDSAGWRLHTEGRGPTEVREVFADLVGAAEAAASDGREPADILLVRLNAIQRSTAAQLTRVVAQTRVHHVVVLYNFAAQPVLDGMRADGMILRREPVTDTELAEVISSLRVIDANAEPAFGARASVPPRRYSDAQLAQVASQPTPMLCECPRHIVDLIGQLASFEEYSRQCLDTDPREAQIHAQLRSIAGSSRALFEHALQMVLEHGGAQDKLRR